MTLLLIRFRSGCHFGPRATRSHHSIVLHSSKSKPKSWALSLSLTKRFRHPAIDNTISLLLSLSLSVSRWRCLFSFYWLTHIFGLIIVYWTFRYELRGRCCRCDTINEWTKQINSLYTRLMYWFFLSQKYRGRVASRRVGGPPGTPDRRAVIGMMINIFFYFQIFILIKIRSVLT